MRSHHGYRRTLFIILTPIVAGVVFAVLFEEKLIYFPSDDFDTTPEELGLRHDELELVTSDGERIHAWFLPAPGAVARQLTVLVCHGNAGNISHRLDRVLLMHAKLGTDVLLFDYRGFGRSEGQPHEEGTYRDARAAYRYLTETREIDPERIVLFGESLGAAVAVELATEVAAAAIVLEAPFTSIADMAKEVYPFLPVTGWIRTRYDNLAKVPKLTLPMLIIHGTEDRTVPFSHGEALYRATSEPKSFFPVPGAGHSDTFFVAGEEYWEAWREFLSALPASP